MTKTVTNFNFFFALLISLALHVVFLFIISTVQIHNEPDYETIDFVFVHPVLIKKNQPNPIQQTQIQNQEVNKTVNISSDVNEDENFAEEIEEEPEEELPPPTQSFEPFYSVDKKPSFINQATLQYPLIEKARGIEGVVILEADIDTNGILQAVRIVKSAGTNFDNAATNMLYNSTFSPGYRKGQAIPVRMRFTIRFTLN